MGPKNLFVPLNRGSFDDFSIGKTFEVRRAERQWNRRQIYTGRGVTVACGYSGPRLYGTIGKVILGDLDRIFKTVPFGKIEPRAKNRKEAKMENAKLIGATREYVAFEIILNEK